MKPLSQMRSENIVLIGLIRRWLSYGRRAPRMKPLDRLNETQRLTVQSVEGLRYCNESTDPTPQLDNDTPLCEPVHAAHHPSED